MARTFRGASARSVPGALLVCAALLPASALAGPLFEDVTSRAGVDSFVPSINRDASPAVFPAFFKAIGEFFGIPGFCGAVVNGDPTSAQPTCEFGPSAYIGGVIVADFDNDGRNDIFATNADGGRNALFVNRGNDASGVARFKDVARRSGASFERDQGSAAVAGDVNNDGWTDLYIANIGFDPGTEFGRTSPAFATLGNLTREDLGIARTLGQGRNRLLLNRGAKDGKWLGFEDVTQRAGAAGERSTRSSSPALVDFDKDGDLDIFVAAHTNVFLIPTPTNFPMWRPGGPGPLSKRVENIACFGNEEGDPDNIIGDGVDQDGDCVPTGGPILLKNMLKERGELRFENVTDLLRAAIDAKTGQPNQGKDGRPFIDSFMSFDGVWFDYDGNGYPDLFMSNDADVVGVFRNAGGSFQFVSGTALVDPNKDTASFGDVGAVGAWMAISHGDVNGDGLIDFYATNAGRGLRGGASDLAGTAFTQPLHALYINLGDGRFVDVADEVDRHEVKPGDPLASFAHPALDDGTTGMPETINGHFAFGGQLFDMDNDGDLDAFNIGNLFGSGVGTRAADPNGGTLDTSQSLGFRVTNGGTLFEHKGTTQTITLDNANTGGPIQVEVPVMDNLTETRGERTAVAGIDNPFDGRGLAIADLNGDGYVEIIAANVSGIGANEFTPAARVIGTYGGGIRVFHNWGVSGNKALVLRLVGDGKRSNTSAFGALVSVDTGSGTPLVRELSSNTGHRGNAGMDLVVGVGQASAADVTIRWPDVNGTTQVLEDVALTGASTCLKVVQGRAPVACDAPGSPDDDDD